MRSRAVLIFAVGLLILFGSVMLFSTSGPQGEKLFGNPYHFIIRHIIWLALGLGGMWIGARVDYHRWMNMAWVILAVTLVLLTLVYVPGVGLNIKGSSRWIRLPVGFTFQPSEVAKFSVISVLALWFGTKRRERRGFVQGMLIPGAILSAVLGLIVLETDFGATILIGLTGGAMMLVAGAPVWYLAPFGLVAGSGVIWMIFQNPERMGRIMAFLEPEKYAQGEAFQLMNALYAFVAGGARGVGLGQSLQKQQYLPEAHTDFIFAIIGEELGLAGSLAVVVLFVTVFMCGLRISGRAADVGGRLMAFGISILITAQASINIGVVSGCLPTKGLPLPFISFGGTSLVITLFMVGVLMNIAAQGGSPLKKRSY